MIIRGFDISLERLKETDIELVREKRNSQDVSQFMEYREHITPEMQRKWFDSINNINNLYYVITHHNKKVGLINGAKIDWDKMETTSGGIFIWETELWSTYVPLMANLVMMDISILLGLKRSHVKILKDNKQAIQYNTMLGYKILPGQENEYNQCYVLEPEVYLEKTTLVRKYLQKLYGSTFDLIVDDPELPVTQFLMDRVDKMPPEYKSRFNIIYPKP
jgi:UDP-4-amino-4,6-dideoxy-N-acetyl-beta-L-altrosamine N-acetyltransferase